ncbi:MAG: hypothetical protein ABIT58_02515, partial [Ferruginibacter sp.]
MNATLNKHRYLTIVISFFIVGFALTSCAKKVSFNVSPVAPAAEGKIKIKKDKNNNYEISIKVQRLANPSRLTPA